MKFLRTCIFFFLLPGVPFVSGQDKPRSHYKELSCPEKRWVIFHPFIAKQTYRLSLQAREVSKALLSDSLFDGDENGGQVDAFRHAYWMALLAQNICWRKARSLGKAHEKGNYRAYKKGQSEEGQLPDSAAGEMDLFNNDAGLEIGRAMKGVTEEDLKRAVRDSVLAGKMKIIRKDAKGMATDCEGNVLDTVAYQRQWNIPKCLVGSDTRRK